MAWRNQTRLQTITPSHTSHSPWRCGMRARGPAAAGDGLRSPPPPPSATRLFKRFLKAWEISCVSERATVQGCASRRPGGPRCLVRPSAVPRAPGSLPDSGAFVKNSAVLACATASSARSRALACSSCCILPRLNTGSCSAAGAGAVLARAVPGRGRWRAALLLLLLLLPPQACSPRVHHVAARSLPHCARARHGAVRVSGLRESGSSSSRSCVQNPYPPRGLHCPFTLRAGAHSSHGQRASQ